MLMPRAITVTLFLLALCDVSLTLASAAEPRIGFVESSVGKPKIDRSGEEIRVGSGSEIFNHDKLSVPPNALVKVILSQNGVVYPRTFNGPIDVQFQDSRTSPLIDILWKSGSANTIRGQLMDYSIRRHPQYTAIRELPLSFDWFDELRDNTPISFNPNIVTWSQEGSSVVVDSVSQLDMPIQWTAYFKDGNTLSGQFIVLPSESVSSCGTTHKQNQNIGHYETLQIQLSTMISCKLYIEAYDVTSNALNTSFPNNHLLSLIKRSLIRSMQP